MLKITYELILCIIHVSRHFTHYPNQLWIGLLELEIDWIQLGIGMILPGIGPIELGMGLIALGIVLIELGIGLG